MALFIAQLAFGSANLLGAAKIGVFGASGVAAVLGLMLGRVLLPRREADDMDRSADEAESSERGREP